MSDRETGKNGGIGGNIGGGRSTNGTIIEERYQSLFKISVAKQTINIILLVLGIVLVAISIATLILDLPFYYALITVIIGVWWIGRFSLHPKKIREKQLYFTANNLREEILNSASTVSFPLSRLLSGIGMVALGVIFFNIYGWVMGENNVGNWFTLNGLTLWYPLGLLPLCVGTGLIIHVIFAKKWVRVSKTEKLFRVEELGFGFVPVITEIPRDRVKAVNFNNTYSGAKFLWIVLLGMQIIWVLVDGFHFLLNPFAFGNGIYAGIAYVTTGIIQCILLFYLLLARQTQLLIITDDKRYQLTFSPMKTKIKYQKWVSAVNDLFEITPNSSDDMFSSSEVSSMNQNVSDEKIRRRNFDVNAANYLYSDYSNIVAGVIFIILASISIVFRFYAGDGFRMLLFLCGIYLIIKGSKEDSNSNSKSNSKSNSRTGRMRLESDTSRVYIHRNSKRWHDSIRVNASPNEFSINLQPIRLLLFDLVIIMGIPAFIGITLAGFFRFVPMESTVWPIGIVYVLISGVVLLVVAHLAIHPQLSVVVNTSSIRSSINLLGLSVDGNDQPRKSEASKHVIPSSHIFRSYIELWKTNKRVVLIRVSLVTLGVSLGLVYALLV